MSGVSPCTADLDESLNALKYAHRVGKQMIIIEFNIDLFLCQASQIRNKPIKNVDPNAQRFIEMQSEITVNDTENSFFFNFNFNKLILVFTRRIRTTTDNYIS